jgi:hypothetical protein
LLSDSLRSIDAPMLARPLARVGPIAVLVACSVGFVVIATWRFRFDDTKTSLA